MAGKQLAALSRRLVAAGWPATTPALVVSRAGWPDQLASEHSVATLGDATVLHSGRPTIVTVGVGAAAGRTRRARDANDHGRRAESPLADRSDDPDAVKFAVPVALACCRAPFAGMPPEPSMTHVVLESCIRCKYTDCVDVCPVDCFREGPNFLTIDPDECIDCAVCIPECPVNAIVPEEDVPGNQQHMIPLNAELAKGWPAITRRKPALPDADDWKDKTGKLPELVR